VTIHSTIFEAGFGTLLDCQGEAVTITPKDAAGIPVSAIVGPEELKTRWEGQRGRQQVRQRVFTFTTDQASRFGGVAALERNARLSYGGIDYAVFEIEGAGGGSIRVCCTRAGVESRGSYLQR
jgi:hypothetical protein